jgi:hypothetical protein
LVFVVATAANLAAQSERPAQPRTNVRPSPQPRVVCGMTIVPADPRIDPAIVKPTPPGHFTLRTLRPAMCGEGVVAGVHELKQRLPYFLGPKR